MAAPYVKRYPGGFVDKPSLTTAVDSAFLNAVESALLQLLGEVPAADEVGVWVGGAGGGLVYQKITNSQIDPAAAIDKSKLAALNIGDADIAAAANIAKSKLGPLNIADADIQAAAAIAISKLAGYPSDGNKVLRGDGTWGRGDFIGFSAYAGVAQSPAAATFTKISYNTEEYDTEGWYDTALFRFTPQLAGKYRFSIKVYASAALNSGVLCRVNLNKNGVLIRNVMWKQIVTGMTDGGMIGAEVIEVANGTTDQFEAWYHQGDSVAREIHGPGTNSPLYNHFQAEYLGP